MYGARVPFTLFPALHLSGIVAWPWSTPSLLEDGHAQAHREISGWAPPPSPGTPRPPAHGFFPALPLALGSNRSPNVPRIPEPPAPDRPDSQLGRLLFASLFFVSPFPFFFCVLSPCSPLSITLRLSPPLVTPRAPSLDSDHPPNSHGGGGGVETGKSMGSWYPRRGSFCRSR